MLTNRSLRLMLFPVVEKSTTGFRSPFGLFIGVQTPNQTFGVFFRPEVSSLVAYLGKPSGLPVIAYGVHRSANPLYAATNLFRSEWCQLGSDQLEDTVMLKHPYPVDGVITPVEQALSVIRCLQITLEDTTIDFRSETAANVLWVAEEKLRTALKVNDAWSEDWQVRSLDDQPEGGEGEA